MKRILAIIGMSLLVGTLTAGRWIIEDRRQTEIRINVDSTGDSSNGGLITVAQDTIRLQETGALIRSLNGVLIVESSSETARGFGLADSAVMTLQTYGMGFIPAILSTRGQLGLPCSLFVGLANVNDTLFKRHIQLIVQVLDTSAADSLVDSITTENGRAIDGYTVHWEFIGRD